MEYTLKTVISFPDDDIDDIETGIESGSLNISEILLSSGINFGEANANKFEATVYGIEDISNKKIYVYQQNEFGMIYPKFTGYVDSCKLDEYGIYRDIVAYDFFYSKGSINIASWWGLFWDNQIESTLGVALRSLLDYVGLDYIDTELANDDLVITQTQEISSMKFIDMLTTMCELELVNPNINASGVLEFIDITDTLHPVNIIGLYEGGNSTFESFNTQSISLVQIFDKNNNIAGNYGTGNNTLIVQNNMFLYDKTTEELQALAESIYNRVSTFYYKPADISMIVANSDIKVGSYVLTSKGVCLVCSNEFSGPLLINQKIKSTGNEILAEAKAYDPLAARLNSQVEEVSQAVDGAGTEYYRISNANAYVINDSGSKVIIHRRYITRKSGLVIFHASVIMDIETIPDTDAFYDGRVRFVLTIQDEELTSYIPTETYTDGRHTIHLSYVYDCDANITDYLTVTCYAEHCKVTIGAYRINGYVCGRGLVGEQVWDGTIEVIEEVETFPLFELTYTERFTEAVTTPRLMPTSITITDTIGTFTLTDLTFTENIEEAVHFGDYLTELTWGDVAEFTWGAVLDNYSWGTPTE